MGNLKVGYSCDFVSKMQGLKFQAFFFSNPLLPWSLNSWHLQVQMFFHYSCSNTLPIVALGTIIIIPDVPYKVTMTPGHSSTSYHDNPRLPATISSLEAKGLSRLKGKVFDGDRWVSLEVPLMERCGSEVFGCRGVNVKFWSLWPKSRKIIRQFGFHGVDTELRLSDCCWRCMPDDFCLPYVEECDLQTGSLFISEVQ